MELVRDTFVLVAEDCPVEAARVPASRGDKPGIAELEHALISAAPYRRTQPELWAEVEARRRALPANEDALAALRAEFLSKPRACMRASPLPKTHGWGVHHDAEGRIAIYPREGADYARLSREAGSVVKAMRSKRA